MGHWKELMPEPDYIQAFHLKGKSVTVTIESVIKGEYIDKANNSKSNKPEVRFVGGKLGLLANTTNCRIIERITGTGDTQGWIGKQVELYPTTTRMGRDTVECIRVRKPTQKS